MGRGAGVFARVVGLALAAVVLSGSGAAAATTCPLSRLRHFPGQDGTIQMTIAVESVPRVSDVPGRRVGPWCWIGVGNASFPYPYAKPAEIVAKPAKGEVRTHTYGVWFKSKAAGPDAFTFRVHQYNPTNNAPVATTYRVDVNVVGAAF